jgi:cobalt-zinc-cadmium efflux system membrane fusion protein
MKNVIAFLALTILASVLSMSQPARAAGDDDHGHKAGEHQDESPPVKGPHKGRLLSDGEFTVELAIFEQGVPPEYRAWATKSGKSLGPADWHLQVDLTRLGGQVDRFDFTPEGDFLRGSGVVGEPHSFDVSVTATHGNQQHHWKYPSYEGRVTLDAATIESSGLTTAVAGPGLLQRQRKVYGRLLIHPEAVSQVSARFPGIVRAVTARVGVSVDAGDVLAQVEANESLRNYNITAPISGMVVARHVNPGDATGDAPLFSLADPSRLIAELTLFPQDAGSVKEGQSVRIRAAGREARGTIKSVVPAAGRATDTVMSTLAARVEFDGATALSDWTPGEAVEGLIGVDTREVALKVDNLALQDFRDWQVVFIQVGDTFEIRPLELGESDGQFTEVMGGLQPGDIYVVGNSFLLKADLEKSGAAHDH